jgi:predicted Zn-dependent peptidase
MIMLNNVLGGPGLNSRLNLNIREKFGFTYSIDSLYNAYSDLGWFGVYLGTDNGTIDKAIKLVHKELKKLREEPLGVLQLSRAKQQLIVQLAISYESGLQETLTMARGHVQNKEVENIERHIQKFEQVTAQKLMEVAQEVFEPSQLSTLIFNGTNTH